MIEELDIIIIGAGPAGLFASINIRSGKRVLIIEKNHFPGRKLLLSGSGKCNITHFGSIHDFSQHYGDNFRFIQTALKEFSNENLIDYLKKHGIYTFVDKNGKVFPVSEKASDVLHTLLNDCKKKKIRIHNDESVESIKLFEEIKLDNSISTKFSITTNKKQYVCSMLIIATGGKSYPLTGSNGDGYKFAESLGHLIVNPRPSLTPVYVKDYKFTDISGVSLENKLICLYNNGKKIRENLGDIVFTHWGLSGPGILDISRYIQAGDILKINLLNINSDEFRHILNEFAQKNGKLSIKMFLKQFELPESLIKLILLELKLNSLSHLASINKTLRNQLIDIFTAYPFVIKKICDFHTAMATCGGVFTKEISPKTMESRLIKNLFFAGEVIDIDGDTGGYNIQAAFSTGYLAAKTINKYLNDLITK